MKGIKKILVSLFFIGGLCLLDAWSKAYVLALPTVWHINKYITLMPVFNAGISWGIFHDTIHTTLLLIAVVSVLIVFIGYALMRALSNAVVVPELLVIAGAFANIIDRIRYGAVVDFIRLSYGQWTFPYFNAADVFIVIGVLAMLGVSWYEQR